MITTLLIAGAVIVFLQLAYLFALFRRERNRQVSHSNSRTENEAEGNGNMQAGGNIHQVMPMDFDELLRGVQADKQRLYDVIDRLTKELAAKDALLADFQRSINIQTLRIYELEHGLNVKAFPVLPVPCRELSTKEPEAPRRGGVSIYPRHSVAV